jgi:hypothetical protein
MAPEHPESLYVVERMLESVSYWTGIKSLLLLAAVLYCISWLTLRWEMRAAKRSPLQQPESQPMTL